MPFICGSSHSQKQDNHDLLWPLSSTFTGKPTRQRHIFGSRSHKTATNPYADSGLEKFEALLADLDVKRHKILTEIGSKDVSMVKFIYKSPGEIKPIVIKLQDDQRKHHNTSSLSTSQHLDHQDNVSFMKKNNVGNEAKEDNMISMVDDHTKKIKSNTCKRKIGDWWKHKYCLPLFVILILVVLMFSHRSFAILCTTIGWYLVPIVNETLHYSKQSNNVIKKELVKSSRLMTRNKHHNRSF